MSLLKVLMPQSIDIVDDIKTTFNARYKSFLETRYDIANLDNENWYSSLLDFMLHPYEERIDYHNIRENHICSSWSDEEKAINFLIINIVLHMGTNLNRFDYYFQEKSSLVNISKAGITEKEENTNSRNIEDNGISFAMNEIAPINGLINSIATPNTKNKSEATTNKSDAYEGTRDKTTTNFDDIVKFIDFTSYADYERECIKTIDNFVFEVNTIY